MTIASDKKHKFTQDYPTERKDYDRVSRGQVTQLPWDSNRGKEVGIDEVIHRQTVRNAKSSIFKMNRAGKKAA